MLRQELGVNPVEDLVPHSSWWSCYRTPQGRVHLPDAQKTNHGCEDGGEKEAFIAIGKARSQEAIV